MEILKESTAVKRGYFVSDEGIMFGVKGNEIGTVNSRGYRESKIRIKGKPEHLTTHRLQAFQKYGIKIYEDGIMVRHRDGNPLNNSWENILIGTASENMMDIPKELRIKNALHATSFIKKYNNQEIKDFHAKFKSYKITMNHFGISSKGTLHYILNH